MNRPIHIGLSRCARCGGDDPNCYVCHEPTEEPDDDPEEIEDHLEKEAMSTPNEKQDAATCSESSSLDEVLAGNALFFLLNLRPLYDFVNNSAAPQNVKDCLRRINLAAASIEGALGVDGYARAKARDEKMKADLKQFLSQNAQAMASADTQTPPKETTL